jgi:ABC-type transport system involved in multi-copper enzyme maturation permease subunit
MSIWSGASMMTEVAALDRIERSGPLRGFGGLLGIELRVWFPWRVLFLIAAGLGVFALIYLPWRGVDVNQLGPLMIWFLGFWIAMLLVSTVPLTEGALLGEIERGTASWLVAMPIARPAVVLAKFTAVAVSLAVTVSATGAAVYPVLADASKRGITDFTLGELFELASQPIGKWGSYTRLPSWETYVAMLISLWTLLLFIAALMLLFGSALRSRTAVFGLGLGAAGIILASALITGSASAATPAGIARAVIDIAQGKEAGLMTPVIGTLLATGVALVLAVWVFNRRELT